MKYFYPIILHIDKSEKQNHAKIQKGASVEYLTTPNSYVRSNKRNKIQVANTTTSIMMLI